jgi:hypothetical protein
MNGKQVGMVALVAVFALAGCESSEELVKSRESKIAEFDACMQKELPSGTGVSETFRHVSPARNYIFVQYGTAQNQKLATLTFDSNTIGNDDVVRLEDDNVARAAEGALLKCKSSLLKAGARWSPPLKR